MDTHHPSSDEAKNLLRSHTEPSTPLQNITKSDDRLGNYSLPIMHRMSDIHLPAPELPNIIAQLNHESESRRSSRSVSRSRSKSRSRHRSKSPGNEMLSNMSSTVRRGRRMSNDDFIPTGLRRRRSSIITAHDGKAIFDPKYVGTVTVDYLRFFCKVLMQEKNEVQTSINTTISQSIGTKNETDINNKLEHDANETAEYFKVAPNEFDQSLPLASNSDSLLGSPINSNLQDTKDDDQEINLEELHDVVSQNIFPEVKSTESVEKKPGFKSYLERILENQRGKKKRIAKNEIKETIGNDEQGRNVLFDGNDEQIPAPDVNKQSTGHLRPFEIRQNNQMITKNGFTDSDTAHGIETLHFKLQELRDDAGIISDRLEHNSYQPDKLEKLGPDSDKPHIGNQDADSTSTHLEELQTQYDFNEVDLQNNKTELPIPSGSNEGSDKVPHFDYVLRTNDDNVLNESDNDTKQPINNDIDNHPYIADEIMTQLQSSVDITPKLKDISEDIPQIGSDEHSHTESRQYEPSEIVTPFSGEFNYDYDEIDFGDKNEQVEQNSSSPEGIVHEQYTLDDGHGNENLVDLLGELQEFSNEDINTSLTSEKDMPPSHKKPETLTKQVLKTDVPIRMVKNLVNTIRSGSTSIYSQAPPRKKKRVEKVPIHVHEMVRDMSNDFLQSVVSDLEAYAIHRNSKDISIKDVVLFLKRMNRTGINDEDEGILRLAQRVLPLEYLISLDNSLTQAFDVGD